MPRPLRPEASALGVAFGLGLILLDRFGGHEAVVFWGGMLLSGVSVFVLTDWGERFR